MTTSHSPREKIADASIGVFGALYGLWYGIFAYAAPNYSFGPNGLFPLYRKTSLETNELDPISIFYIRVHGLNTLFLVLSYYLFTRGSKERKRAHTKMLLAEKLASVATVLRIMTDKDFDEFYARAVWQFFLALGVLYIIWFASILERYPVPKKVEQAPLSSADMIWIVLTAIHAGYFCIHTLVIGPIPIFWQATPLENNGFDLIMRESAHMMATSLVPIVLFLSTDAWTMPTFCWKMLCLYMIICTPVMFKQIYDDSGFSDQKAFIGHYFGIVFSMILGFERLGVFKKDKLLAKDVKASKAA